MLEKKDVKKFRTSRKAYFIIYLMIIILIITIVSIKVSGKDLDNLAFQASIIFSVVLIAFIEIHRYSIFYEITESSLVYSKGILSRKTRKVDLISISDADSKQTAWQRLLNYGDVDARMFSKDSTMSIKKINNPEKFADLLEEKMNKKRTQGEGGMSR